MQRANRKSQIRPPKPNALNKNRAHSVENMLGRNQSNSIPESSTMDTLGPLPSHRPKTQGLSNKQFYSGRMARGALGLPLKGAKADATDLNILWRVQARKAEGKKTTPEQMAKLRLMLKNENSGESVISAACAW